MVHLHKMNRDAANGVHLSFPSATHGTAEGRQDSLAVDGGCVPVVVGGHEFGEGSSGEQVCGWDCC